MILIGLSENQKHKEICDYVHSHEVKNVIVFSPKKFSMTLPELDVPIREIEYNEVIMYRTFYPLLGEIDSTYLLVVNEFLRDGNRNNLTYNCLRHYLNQCGHTMVFEYFPFITDTDEFMSLLDFGTNSKFKGSGFDYELLKSSDIRCINHNIKLTIDTVKLPETAETEYQTEKERLFDDIGSRDPNIIPRELELFAGRYKKAAIISNYMYAARNSRLKLKNVISIKNANRGDYILIDMPYRQTDINDYIKMTGQSNIRFISTGLSVDEMHINQFNAWTERLGDFYAKTSVYQQNC